MVNWWGANSTKNGHLQEINSSEKHPAEQMDILKFGMGMKENM
jgi:hypothetical protein